jgi:hypothetical protein
MSLPLYDTFTDEQLRQFGPARECEVISATERHVYTTPFLYPNVEAGNFYEIDPTKGIEFKADDGYLTITETRPIIAVTVVGSGCVPGGYNICEWWDEGEDIEDFKDQLVKRQRVDGLDGTHPSIWSLVLMGKAPEVGFGDIAPGRIQSALDCLRELSDRYYGGYYLGLYENTATFRIGPPNPRRVTVRCGCKCTEDPGTDIARYPGDYAIRLVETLVVA